mgnify:CR=1 FL=1
MKIILYAAGGQGRSVYELIKNLNLQVVAYAEKSKVERRKPGETKTKKQYKATERHNATTTRNDAIQSKIKFTAISNKPLTNQETHAKANVFSTCRKGG